MGTEDTTLDVTPPENTAVIPIPDADSGPPTLQPRGREPLYKRQPTMLLVLDRSEDD